MSEAQLPTEIPPFLSDAKNFAGDQRWEDGPQTVTEIRNLLVHPTKKLRSTDVPSPVLIESARLAMWYLEAVLSSSFNMTTSTSQTSVGHVWRTYRGTTRSQSLPYLRDHASHHCRGRAPLPRCQ